LPQTLLTGEVVTLTYSARGDEKKIKATGVKKGGKGQKRL